MVVFTRVAMKEKARCLTVPNRPCSEKSARPCCKFTPLNRLDLSISAAHCECCLARPATSRSSKRRVIVPYLLFKY